MEAIYSGPVMSSTVNRLGNTVHRLADDIEPPLRDRRPVTIQRDPLVQALFGDGPARRATPTRAKPARS